MANYQDEKMRVRMIEALEMGRKQTDEVMNTLPVKGKEWYLLWDSITEINFVIDSLKDES